jgi:hypothetical protein
VDEVEVLFGHLRERRGYHLTEMERLVPPRDHALAHEVDDASRTELGVDAEIVLVSEESQQSRRTTPDARFAATWIYWARSRPIDEVDVPWHEWGPERMRSLGSLR